MYRKSGNLKSKDDGKNSKPAKKSNRVKSVSSDLARKDESYGVRKTKAPVTPLWEIDVYSLPEGSHSFNR